MLSETAERTERSSIEQANHNINAFNVNTENTRGSTIKGEAGKHTRLHWLCSTYSHTTLCKQLDLCCFCTLTQCQHTVFVWSSWCVWTKIYLCWALGDSVAVIRGPRNIQSRLAHSSCSLHTEETDRMSQLIRNSHRHSWLNLLQSSGPGRERTRNP